MTTRGKLFIGYYIITFVMMAIFMSAPLIQSFHSHDTVSISVASDQDALISYDADCDLCDHFTHQQQHYFLSLTPFSVTYFGNVPAIPTTHHVVGPVALPGLSWTNKGPPTPLA